MKYDAFISYRHADLDLYVAKKVHKALETFKVPKAVAKKTGKKNIKRVFRDQEELPIGSDLGDNIESALSQSEYLLVICSPRTPESYWVQKEIDTFIGIHGKDKVLAVLIEGEPNEAFPPQLLTDDEGNPVEPLAADVRGATKGERNRKMKTEIMRLAAPLLGCSYDDLKQRHRERKMKRMAAMAAAVAVFALAFGAYHAYNAALIQENYEGKQRNQSKYLAETSLSLLQNGDRRAAVLVALEALPSEKNDRPYVAEAQYALSEALYVYDTG
ncbi:MAG: toll/interleukin-1 receptor domain-containing protein, partial [Lachnospiraceae bacterium]|nr:toll/interleukin-1 receptor domain-containing protein [Lachnospiraceae bacterium]